MSSNFSFCIREHQWEKNPFNFETCNPIYINLKLDVAPPRQSASHLLEKKGKKKETKRRAPEWCQGCHFFSRGHLLFFLSDNCKVRDGGPETSGYVCGAVAWQHECLIFFWSISCYHTSGQKDVHRNGAKAKAATSLAKDIWLSFCQTIVKQETSVNFSCMSPKLVQTYPQTVENWSYPNYHPNRSVFLDVKLTSKYVVMNVE